MTSVHIDPDNLKCPVCVGLLTEPKLLSCAHTFCKTCLREILACSPQRTANCLSCPKCRNPTTVQGGDVNNLKTNFDLKAVVDDLKDSKQLCDMCDTESKATPFCIECGKNMCNTCLNKHNNWPPHLKHKLVSVEDIRAGKVVLKKKVFCKEHEQDEEEYVCTDVCLTCKKFICFRCMLNHEKKGHTVQSGKEYKASTKTKIESLQDRGKTKSTTIKNHQKRVESQKYRITKHIDGKRDEINNIRQESMKKINESWAALDKQLKSETEILCKKLDEMTAADERLVKSVESAIVLAGNSLKAPLDSDTILIHDSLSGDLKTVLGWADPQEKLATDVADHSEQLIFTPSNHRDQLDIGEIQLVQCKLKHNVELPKKDSMNFILSLEKEVVVGNRFYGSAIIFIKPDGELEEANELRDVDAAFCGMGILSDNECVLAMTNEIKFGVLVTKNSSDDKHECETLSKEKGGCVDLTVDSSDLIYVSYSKAKKIQVFSPTGGKAIREIPCNGYEPRQITSYRDLLVITDTSIIRVIDKKGNVKHKVHTAGFSVYAAVTRNDSILIAWVKHNDGLVSIDEYNEELKHIKTIVSNHKIEKPGRNWYYLDAYTSQEIAFCTPDRLYVFKLTITPINVQYPQYI